MAELSIKDGRIWMQTKKFQPYRQLLPYGMTDLSDPAGSLNAIREPDNARRRVSVVVDILRGEPALPGFTITTRLKNTLNYMLGLKNKKVNFQAHMGACDRADKYPASSIGFHFEKSERGDLTMNQLAQIQGDNAPVDISVPWSAQIGPIPLDFNVEFLSARTIAETENITDMVFITDPCNDIATQYDPGDNGYAVTAAAAGSPANKANVWYTANAGQDWAHVAADAFPFDGGEDISCVVLSGEKNNHRVIVSRGTADGSNPAEIAYGDVTSMGTVVWTLVDVGSVNGQFINYMFWLNWNKLYAVTNDGYIYLSKDGGVSWTAKLTTGVVNLTDIAALRDGTVWAVGASNTVLFSNSFGNTWTTKTGPTDANGDALTDSIDTVGVTPDGTVIIGNAAGGQYGTYDDALTWTTLQLQGITPTAVKRIRAADDESIWVAANIADGSGRVLRSTDGGATFLLWSLNLPSNSGLNALALIDQNYVYVGGDVNGGSAFISRTDPLIIGLAHD